MTYQLEKHKENEFEDYSYFEILNEKCKWNNGTCQFCDNCVPATELHHSGGDGCFEYDDFIAVCGDCHKRIDDSLATMWENDEQRRKKNEQHRPI